MSVAMWQSRNYQKLDSDFPTPLFTSGQSLATFLYLALWPSFFEAEPSANVQKKGG